MRTNQMAQQRAQNTQAYAGMANNGAMSSMMAGQNVIDLIFYEN